MRGGFNSLRQRRLTCQEARDVDTRHVREQVSWRSHLSTNHHFLPNCTKIRHTEASGLRTKRKPVGLNRSLETPPFPRDFIPAMQSCKNCHLFVDLGGHYQDAQTACRRKIELGSSEHPWAAERVEPNCVWCSNVCYPL